jgi:hypothetical protein
MTAMAVEVRTRPLTKQDRCDRCTGAAARVARNTMEKELFFCEHHSETFKDSLLEKGFYFDIETLEQRL